MVILRNRRLVEVATLSLFYWNHRRCYGERALYGGGGRGDGVGFDYSSGPLA